MGVPAMSLPTHCPSEDAQDLREAILDLVGRVTKRYDRAYWRACEDEDRAPAELSAALGEAGLLGIGVSPEMGGIGGGMVEQVVLVEALGRVGIPSYGYLIGNFTRGLVIEYGTPAQIEQWLPATFTGEKRSCFALTEADAGTNSFAMRTRAEKVDGGWKVNGQKTYISAAGESSQMMLVARTAPYNKENRKAGLSLFILDTKSAGISMTRLNIRATAPERQYTVHFDDVFIPDEGLIGEPDVGIGYLFGALNPERIVCAAQAASLGYFVLEKGIAYAGTRAPFGKPIGGYQAVQHPLARSFIQLEAARLMTYEAAAAIDRGEDAGQSSNAAKWLASEAANAALDAAIQTHGGAAFDRDADVVTLYESLRQFRITPINNEIVLSYTAEHTLGLPRAH